MRHVEHSEIKARLARLKLTFVELANELGVSVAAVHRATRNDPFLGKLRRRIVEKLNELEKQKRAA